MAPTWAFPTAFNCFSCCLSLARALGMERGCFRDMIFYADGLFFPGITQNSISLYIQTLLPPFIYLWEIGCSHMLAVVNNAAMNMGLQTDSNSFRCITKLGLLYYMVILVFIFSGLSMHILQGLVFYTLTNCEHFSTAFPELIFNLFYNTSIWACLIVVLIFILLIISNSEHFFIYLLIYHISSFEKNIFMSSAHS
jgi:hypothetical protein